MGITLYGLLMDFAQRHDPIFALFKGNGLGLTYYFLVRDTSVVKGLEKEIRDLNYKIIDDFNHYCLITTQIVPNDKKISDYKCLEDYIWERK